MLPPTGFTPGCLDARGGDAVASVLLGDIPPAGKLPFTWPRHVGQVPIIYSHNRTFEQDAAEQLYHNGPGAPQYPFGHGLSYASFEYTNLQVSEPSIPQGGSVTISVDVTNTSDRTADEIAQLYVHQRYGTSSRPVRDLKGFTRQSFSPRETRTLTFELGPTELSYWTAVTRSTIQDRTTIEAWVGGSSAAEVSVTFSLAQRLFASLPNHHRAISASTTSSTSPRSVAQPPHTQKRIPECPLTHSSPRKSTSLRG